MSRVLAGLTATSVMNIFQTIDECWRNRNVFTAFDHVLLLSVVVVGTANGGKCTL